VKRFILFALLAPLLAGGQEPIYMPAATQPAVGLGYLRTQLIYRELGRGGGLPAEDEWKLWARYTQGIRYNVSLSAETAYVDRDENGLEDLRISAKWRVLQNDLGPVNTVRGSLIGGVELPTGSDENSTDSADPFFGGVITGIVGRHGMNASAIWQINTGGGPDSDDEFSYDASWLYRLAPTRWKPDTKASFYTVLEFNGRVWEGGDHELLVAPGLLYEARRWAAEIAIHLPLFEEVDGRRPEDFGAVAGVRYLF